MSISSTIHNLIKVDNRLCSDGDLWSLGPLSADISIPLSIRLFVVSGFWWFGQVHIHKTNEATSKFKQRLPYVMATQWQ